MIRRIDVEEGTADADIGMANQERLAKGDLAIRIAEIIRARQLTQRRAAHILKIDQPRVSRLLRGQLAEFSTARLMYFLTLLGLDIEIVVKPASYPGGPGSVRVVTTWRWRTQ